MLQGRRLTMKSRPPKHGERTVRKAIPRAIKAEVLRRSGGMCEAPGCGNVGRDMEHRIPVALGGENTAENLWLACVPCHRAKTSGEDIPRIAKAKRQAGETGQTARRERAKAAGKRRLQSQKLRSGGFKKAEPQRSATRPVEKRT
jgi:5-methylcytosine-specific restriction endonuclease McrA